MREPFAARLGWIPPYLFQELDDLKARTGGDLIDLGEGSPDQPAPKPISAALTKALKNTENHRYPSYPGKLAARAAVAAWYRRRFAVELDPETEVAMLLGSKEGVAHLIWGTCGPGDTVAVSDPGYPVYQNQSRLCGATPIPVPLEEKTDFLPDLDWLSRIAPRIKLLCLNFPGNPTAAVASIEFYRAVVALAERHGFFVVNDNVYSELYFGRVKPPSILEVPGAMEHCVEFHSLSKTFNMAGWRIGMAVGNARLIKALLKIKQNTDSGPFGVLDAGPVRRGQPRDVPAATGYVLRRTGPAWLGRGAAGCDVLCLDPVAGRARHRAGRRVAIPQLHAQDAFELPGDVRARNRVWPVRRRVRAVCPGRDRAAAERSGAPNRPMAHAK
jgi:LL-diaminopimelate aminotransferase